MIHVQLNGEARDIQANTLLTLIDELSLQGKRIAVEYNLEIIPRSEYQSIHLKTGDTIEIVRAIGGG